ncbi:MAG: hypothetical protein ABR616_17995 [Dermatophilaceae bacterium]|nr:hypothetical protein [Intrasporangiaceae bacterium]
MKPSEILNRVMNYRLVRLATDRGYLVEVEHKHLYGVASGEAAQVAVKIWQDRGENPEQNHREFWMLLSVKPRSTSFAKGMHSELFTHDMYDAPKEMETALCNNSFLNSSRYGGNNTEEIPTW